MNMEKQKYVIIIADENSDEMVKFSNPISAWAYMIAREEYKKPKKDAFKIVDLVFDMWLKDSNYTPIGHLVDYVCENYDKLIKMDSVSEQVIDFYENFE